MNCRLHRLAGQRKAPARRTGACLMVGLSNSVAAINQTPTRAPWRRDQVPHIAAAVAIEGRAADIEAGTTEAPAMMEAAVPAKVSTGKRRGGSRRQGGCCERSCGYC